MNAARGASFPELLEQLFEDAPLPLSVLDPDGDVVRENAAQSSFNEALGAELGIGRFNSLTDLRAVARGHAAQFRRALLFETVEYTLTLAKDALDGGVHQHAFQRLLLPMGSSGGRPTYVVSVIVDVSDRQRAEAEREQLNAQLLHAQKLESLGVLAGGIAHDFNNLLTGVLGNAELLSRKLAPGSLLHEPVEAIRLAASRATEVAQHMLAYAGKTRVERHLLALDGLLTESMDLLRVAIGGRHPLVTELDASLPLIEADATQVQQIVLNLVTNACEAMQRGVGSVRLRTGVSELSTHDLLSSYHGPELRPGRFVYLEVEDEGHGMDAATQRRIFDPFFSTKFEGRGLGLSSVLGIVQSHGAALQVHTERGTGTRFRVLFPAREGEGQRRDPVTYERLVRRTHAVLVIDDEAVVRMTAGMMLEELGCSVREASSGSEGLRLFREAPDAVDVVLLDLSMPELDGESTLRELRALRPALRVVMMSGYDAKEAMQRVPEDDRTAFLRKPFTFSSLSRALDAAFARGREHA